MTYPNISLLQLELLDQIQPRKFLIEKRWRQFLSMVDETNDSFSKIEEARKKYYKSPKGKASQQKWFKTPKGKEARKRYLESEKGKEALVRYKLSEKGKETKEVTKARAKLLAECKKWVDEDPENRKPEDFFKSLIEGGRNGK